MDDGTDLVEIVDPGPPPEIYTGLVIEVVDNVTGEVYSKHPCRDSETVDMMWPALLRTLDLTQYHLVLLDFTPDEQATA